VYIAPAGQTGGKLYAVIPLGAQPGYRGAWRLSVQESFPPKTYTVAAPKSGRPACTCPDHEQRGTVCKHIRALGALGLLKLSKDKPAPSAARGRKAHAKNAKAAIAEAKTLPAEARCHLAAMGPEPAPAAPAIVLPEGWQLGGAALRPAAAPAPKALPPVPAGSFAAGFRQAVADHLALRRGDLVECAACRYPFDPETEGSAPLALCGPGPAEEKGGRS
jgi:hypothetical protein